MSRKPLGIKNYGSIPHLPNSRLGPGDHSCHEGQARIATEEARDRHDTIIVQEKLDGSNVGVAKVNGQIVPLSRAGYRAETSPYKQHHMFADWVLRPGQYGRFDAVLKEGERIVGEWLAQAHGTRYDLFHEPFVAFDLMVGSERLIFDEFRERAAKQFVLPWSISKLGPMTVEHAMNAIGEHGMHGAVDPIEGFVWRVERHGKVDFLVKWVRPDKQDGKYLEVVTGGQPVWNWQPQKIEEVLS